MEGWTDVQPPKPNFLADGLPYFLTHGAPCMCTKLCYEGEVDPSSTDIRKIKANVTAVEETKVEDAIALCMKKLITAEQVSP